VKNKGLSLKIAELKKRGQTLTQKRRRRARNYEKRN